MSSPPIPSAKARNPLLLLMLGGLLVLLGFYVVTQWQDRRQALADAERNTSNLAASIRVHAEQILQRADDAAIQLVQLVESMPPAGNPPPVLHELMLHHTGGASSVLQEISVYDAEGALRFGSSSRPDATTTRERDFFVHHRGTARDLAFVGRPYQVGNDGRWVVPLSRRVSTADGRFGGVVVAAVDIGAIRPYLQSFDVGRSGSVTLLSREGFIIDRHPATATSVGFDARASELMRFQANAGRSGTATLVSAVDGVERQYSFEQGAGFPIIAVAATGRQEVLASWAASAVVSGGVLASLLIALAWLSRAAWLAAGRERAAASELAASHRRLEDVERAVREHAVIAVTDVRGRIVDVNQKFCELSGYAREELLGQTHRLVNSGLHSPEFFRDLWRTIAQGDVWHGVIANRSKNGQVYHVDSTIVPLRGPDGRPERYIAVRTDVTELRRLAERLGTAMQNLERANVELEQLAWIDSLTLLANRRRIDAAIAAELKRAQRSAAPLSLLMIDVDRFKQFNDLYGHSAGDECLRRVGAALKQAERRSGDLAGRWGGEEFVLLLPHTDGRGAEVVAQSVRQAIEGLDIAHQGHEAGHVTVSIGVASLDWTTGSHAAAALVDCADRALYRAKHGGRNRVCLHRSEAGATAESPDTTVRNEHASALGSREPPT